jgi:hypothetical protein
LQWDFRNSLMDAERNDEAKLSVLSNYSPFASTARQSSSPGHSQFRQLLPSNSSVRFDAKRNNVARKDAERNDAERNDAAKLSGLSNYSPFASTSRQSSSPGHLQFRQLLPSNSSVRFDAKRNNVARKDAERNDYETTENNSFFTNSNSRKFTVQQQQVKPLEPHREHNTQQDALNYSNLKERVNILERELVEEKRLRWEWEDNFRRNPLVLRNQHMELVRGENPNVNDFLKRSKDQSETSIILPIVMAIYVATVMAHLLFFCGRKKLLDVRKEDK